MFQFFRLYDNSNLEIDIYKCQLDRYHLILALIKHEHIFQRIEVNLYQCILLLRIMFLVTEQLLLNCLQDYLLQGR